MRNLIIVILITIYGAYGSDGDYEIKTLTAGKGAIQLIFGIGCLAVSYIEPSIYHSNELDSYNNSYDLAYGAWEKLPARSRPPFEFNVDKPKWGKGRWGYILIGTFTGIALTYTGVTDLYISYNLSNKSVEIKKKFLLNIKWF